jgi:nucleoside-diphosphate-sugar epimerase
VKAVVTGATGFVGTALLLRMNDDARFIVRAAVRNPLAILPNGIERTVCGDLSDPTHWREVVSGVDAVVHLAARVHVMAEGASDPLEEFRRVNVSATLGLADQAALAGVRRFVYVSSVKVNGENGAFTETDPPAPVDPYSVSKYEAELGLRDIAARTGMQVVIIRPPLVYGPGVGANFRALMCAVSRGLPLPLGAVHNLRSLVAVDNLADFILTCLDHPAAANEIFFVSDGEDLSTTDLIRRLARAIGRQPHLVPVPSGLLRAMAVLVGRRDAVSRLLGSLQVDITKARDRLGWTPPLTVDAALRLTVDSFR